MNVRVVVPVAVSETVRALTNCSSIGPAFATVGGHSNLSFRTLLDGATDVVVKSAADPRKRDDLRREARLLSRISALSLMAPSMIVHGEGDGVTVTVLHVLPGTHGLEAVQARQISTLTARAAVMGTALRRVHLAAPIPDVESELVRRHAEAATALAGLALAADLAEAMTAALDAPVHRRGDAFVHGDFGFHNTLWTNRLSGLLDWEFAGWGNPLVDVAWFWWTLRLRSVDNSVWLAFAEAYGMSALQAIGFTAVAVDALVRAQMIVLLVRTAPESETRAIWLDRWHALAELGPATLD